MIFYPGGAKAHSASRGGQFQNYFSYRAFLVVLRYILIIFGEQKHNDFHLMVGMLMVQSQTFRKNRLFLEIFLQPQFGQLGYLLLEKVNESSTLLNEDTISSGKDLTFFKNTLYGVKIFS